MRYSIIAMLFAMTAAVIGCAGQMNALPLPQDAQVTVPGANVAKELVALSGSWKGSWLVPGAGVGYDGVLIVEQVNPDTATIVYAWGNNPWKPNDSGWYRRRVDLLQSPAGVEWKTGTFKFSFRLNSDGSTLSGTIYNESTLTSLITMSRSTAPPPPTPRTVARPAMPPLPVVNIVSAPPGLPVELAGLVGTWEGSWDGELFCRLVVEHIDGRSAQVVYAWADDPRGTFKGDYQRREAMVSAEVRGITWGDKPRITFRLSPDRKKLLGEWENDGRLSLITMTKAK